MFAEAVGSHELWWKSYELREFEYHYNFNLSISIYPSVHLPIYSFMRLCTGQLEFSPPRTGPLSRRPFPWAHFWGVPTNDPRASKFKNRVIGIRNPVFASNLTMHPQFGSVSGIILDEQQCGCLRKLGIPDASIEIRPISVLCSILGHAEIPSQHATSLPPRPFRPWPWLQADFRLKSAAWGGRETSWPQSHFLDSSWQQGVKKKPKSQKTRTFFFIGFHEFRNVRCSYCEKKAMRTLHVGIVFGLWSGQIQKCPIGPDGFVHRFKQASQADSRTFGAAGLVRTALWLHRPGHTEFTYHWRKTHQMIDELCDNPPCGSVLLLTVHCSAMIFNCLK